MTKNLVIVESPSKSKTIEKYLGKDFTVVSSKGHIRDLSTSSATWHANAGFVIDILELSIKPDHYFDTFGFYVGAGYGVYQHAWQLNTGAWVEYGPTSAHGVSATAGVIGSVHGFTLKAGVSTIDFKYMEIEAGIGWMF